MKRTTINHRYANNMINIYSQVKYITDDGGVAYETKSAIWAYEPSRDKVTLFVKNPTNMSNEVLEYAKFNHNFERHKKRILKLTGAKPTAYKATA